MNNSLKLMALCALFGGCTEVRYVGVPTVPNMPATPALQACADHAARAQKQTFGNQFNALQLDTAGLVLTAPELGVGNQKVGAVYDGAGRWYGAEEYRKIHFHCLLSPKGQVVYTFVRAE